MQRQRSLFARAMRLRPHSPAERLFRSVAFSHQASDCGGSCAGTAGRQQWQVRCPGGDRRGGPASGAARLCEGGPCRRAAGYGSRRLGAAAARRDVSLLSEPTADPARAEGVGGFFPQRAPAPTTRVNAFCPRKVRRPPNPTSAAAICYVGFTSKPVKLIGF
jgi:hypothetical protein